MLKQAVATATITYENAGEAFVGGTSGQQAEFLRGMFNALLVADRDWLWAIQCRSIECEFEPDDMLRNRVAEALRELADHLQDPLVQRSQET